MSAPLKKSATPTPEGGDLFGRIAWLNQVRLFQEIRALPGAVEHLARLMEMRTYPVHAVILNEGEEGADAFFLTTGAIKVLKTIAGGETFPVAILEAKDHPFFGEAALLQNDRRSASIRTETECTCLILHKNAFDAFCHSNPEWALPVVLCIARVVLERLHKANNDVVLLYNALVSEAKGWTP